MQNTVNQNTHIQKAKDESANRFMSWLIPYNHEFENEEELIKIIEEINLKVNKQVNSSTGVAPIMLFTKEKEYLKPLPNEEILKQYLKRYNPSKSIKFIIILLQRKKIFSSK